MDDKLSIVATNEEEPQLESEEDYKQLDAMTSPLAVNWFKRGLLKGVLLIDDDALMLYDSRTKPDNVFKSSNIVGEKESLLMNKKKRKRDNDNHHTCCQVFDVCPICFQPWSSDGAHQICSLSCGHIYGRSCINKLLQQEDQSSPRKCPQCNFECTLKDIKPLYGTRLSIAKHKLSIVAINEEEPQLDSEDEEKDYEKLEEMKSPVAVNWIEGGLVKGIVMIDDDALLLYDSKSKSNFDYYVSKTKLKYDNGNKVSLLNNSKKRKIRQMKDTDNHTCPEVFDLSKSNNVVDVNDDDQKESFPKNNKKKRDNDNHHTCCEAFDVCPICYEPWTSYGLHQLCSLPCGHIYGSCINKWLQQDTQSSSRKCPQCNTLCTLEDVRLLLTSRLSIAKHKQASSSDTTISATRQFPFTKKGYKALKKYVWQRTSVAMRLGSVSSNQRAYVARRAKDAMDRVCFITKCRDELLKCRTGAEGPQADAFLQRADALDLQIPPLARHAEALAQRDYALGQQHSAICRLSDAYIACVDYFEQMCKRFNMDAVLVEE